MIFHRVVRHCWRCTHAHLTKHRRKYASGALIYAALILFAVDLTANVTVLPWLHAFIEGQRWTVPFATLAGHAGFILERTA